MAIERSLIWARKESQRGSRWLLAAMARNPSDKSPDWHSAMIWDGAFDPLELYDHAPTTAEVDKFARQSFKFAPALGFALVDGEVCEGTWQQLFGGVSGKRYAQ